MSEPAISILQAIGDQRLLGSAFFWISEDMLSPDVEIIAAIRPAMATIPGSMLICASSPYARRGALWDAYRRHYGRDDANVLVWRAPTLTMNPSVPRRVIDEAFESDPISASAEYNAEFRTDVESYVSREAVEACIESGVLLSVSQLEGNLVAFEPWGPS